MRVSLFVPAALLSLLPLACGESNPQPQDPNQYAAGQYPPGQYPPGQSTAPQPYPTQTAPQPYPTQTAPQPTATATGAAGAQATPVAGPGAMAADAILTGLAQQEAPGAQPEGTAFAGQFQEGQVLEQPINLQPGKCYTVIAGSVGPIQELDIFIQGQLPPLPPGTFAQDSTTGPTATLGGKAAGCWKNPAPIAIPATIVLKATRGSGMAGAKVYVK